MKALSRELSKYFIVNVFVYGEIKSSTLLKTAGAQIYTIPRMHFPMSNLISRTPEGRKVIDALTAINPKFFFLAQRIAPADCIICVDHYCSIIIGPLVRLMGKRFVLRANDSLVSLSLQMTRSYSRMKGLLLLVFSFLVEWYVSLFSSAIFVPSRKTHNQFQKYYGFKKKIFLSPQGNDLDFTFKMSKNKFGLTETQPLILFIGTGNWPPNILAINFILEVLAPYLEKELPNARILIIGSKTESFQNKVKSSNLTILGEVPNIEPYLDNADIAIAPGYIIGGVSSKVIEYLCSGLPTIATDAVAETIFPQTGLFVSTMPDFCSTVKKLCTDHSLNDMKLKIKQEALQNYSWSRIAYDFATYIQSMLNK